MSELIELLEYIYIRTKSTERDTFSHIIPLSLFLHLLLVDDLKLEIIINTREQVFNDFIK